MATANSAKKISTSESGTTTKAPTKAIVKTKQPAKASEKPTAKTTSKPAARSAAKTTIKKTVANSAGKTVENKATIPKKTATKTATKTKAVKKETVVDQLNITDTIKATSAEKPAKASPKQTTTARISTSKTINATPEDKWHEIRQNLLEIKAETLSEINKAVKIGTVNQRIEETTGDIYDQASSERERELGLLLNDRERDKLYNIDEALLKMADGDYGICEECEEDIPFGRLKVLPFTRHCVKCKAELEKFQAQTRRIDDDRAYREIPVSSEDDDS